MLTDILKQFPDQRWIFFGPALQWSRVDKFNACINQTMLAKGSTDVPLSRNTLCSKLLGTKNDRKKVLHAEPRQIQFKGNRANV